jgi:hypothetical protein
MREVSTRVLPEPAPATISKGLPVCSTAARCCGLSPSRRRRTASEASPAWARFDDCGPSSAASSKSVLTSSSLGGRCDTVVVALRPGPAAEPGSAAAQAQRYSGLGWSGSDRSQSEATLPCTGIPPVSLSMRAKCSMFQVMNVVLRVVQVLRSPPASPSR